MCGDLFGGNADTSWPLLLAFSDEREAAAFLATAAKVARRACPERARAGKDRKACAAVMGWLEGISLNLWRAADHVALRVAVELGFRNEEPSAPVQERGMETEASVGTGGGGNGGGSGDDGGAGGGPIRASGSGGGENDGSTNDHGSSGGSGSIGDGRCVYGRAEDSANGAGACGGESDVRSSARTSGVSCSDGGDSARGSGNEGCGDRLGGDGSSRSGGGCTDSGTWGGGGNLTACATAATTHTAGSLSPPEKQLMRLLSFALRLWLPLWLDLASTMISDGRLTRSWRGWVHRAFELLDFVQHMCADAFEKKDLHKAESWRSIVGRSGDEVEGMLEGCRRLLEREQAAAGVLPLRERSTRVREELYMKIEEVREAAMVLGADLQEAMVARGQVEGGWKGPWPLVGLELLAPPCDARQVLPCCSNPRCAELAGDSEAGVVLRRCGGACGGAAAYCCAACQRAHWAAGHREECVGNKAEARVAGTG